LKSRKVTESYEGWYNFQIPQIDTKIVERNLLSFRDIAGLLDVSESFVEEWVERSNVPNYSVDNLNLVRRPELDGALRQFPLNMPKGSQF
jgi:hypothetical protein